MERLPGGVPVGGTKKRISLQNTCLPLHLRTLATNAPSSLSPWHETPQHPKIHTKLAGYGQQKTTLLRATEEWAWNRKGFKVWKQGFGGCRSIIFLFAYGLPFFMVLLPNQLQRSRYMAAVKNPWLSTSAFYINISCNRPMKSSYH